MLSKDAGQVLHGSIHVNLVEPMFPSTGLELTLKGNENSFRWARLVEGSGDDKKTDIREH